MSDTNVTSMGIRKFHVRIRDGDLETSHHVTVPERL